MRLGSHHTAEALAKMSMAGRNPSPETRAKMSASHLGKTIPDEQKAKISSALKGRIKSPETCAKLSAVQLGRKKSPEACAKMSASHRGKPISKETLAKRSASQWRGGTQISRRKVKAKRRDLGFVPLNEPLLGCEGHHVDKEQVIHMPKKLHRSVYHNHYTGQGMAKINAIAYNFLFKQEVEAAMSAGESAYA
jgi:hypothetical protein